MSTTIYENMYKTVRHGENSLQYKILAQQEEGVTNSNTKYKKTKNRKIFGVIVIVLILVCGIIATAVLIPLVLANDFITLTGTFQKFSVSTLRRTHTGNHVVVIAKKPHGWTGSRQSFLQSNQLTNISLLDARFIRKHLKFNGKRVPCRGKNECCCPKISDAEFNNTLLDNSTEKVSGAKGKQTVSLDTYLKNSSKPQGLFLKDKSLNNSNGKTENSDSILPTKSLNFNLLFVNAKNSKDCITKTTPIENIPTKIPFWSSGKKWSFESSTNFSEWVKSRILNNSVLIALGALLLVTFLVFIFAFLIRNFSSHKKHLKEFTGQNEDKTELLRPSVRGSDEE